MDGSIRRKLMFEFLLAILALTNEVSASLSIIRLPTLAAIFDCYRIFIKLHVTLIVISPIKIIHSKTTGDNIKSMLVDKALA